MFYFLCLRFCSFGGSAVALRRACVCGMVWLFGDDLWKGVVFEGIAELLWLHYEIVKNVEQVCGVLISVFCVGGLYE